MRMTHGSRMEKLWSGPPFLPVSTDAPVGNDVSLFPRALSTVSYDYGVLTTCSRFFMAILFFKVTKNVHIQSMLNAFVAHEANLT
eukprot:c5456_g1_i2 orf=190-444(+)